MKIRVFADFNLNQDIFELHDDNVHYLRNVLKCNEGDIIFLFNAQIEIEACILSVSKNKITCKRSSEFVRSEILEIDITFFLPILKREKIQQIIKQLVELGVSNVIFYKSLHSSNGDKINIEKCRLNVVEGLKQSNGITLTNISEKVIDISCIPELVGDDLLVLANEKKKDSNCQIKGFNKIFLMIGPEGGFTDQELSFFNKSNHVHITLGNRILKAETAAVALCASIKSFYL